MIFGLTAFRCSAPRPIFSSAPGRFASTNTSDFAASLRITSCACGALQVEHQAALVAVERGEAHALAVADRRRGAAHVAARRLDLDHVGAHVGEQRAAQRAGDEVRQLDDADAGERLAHCILQARLVDDLLVHRHLALRRACMNAAGPSAVTGRPILSNFSLTSGSRQDRGQLLDQPVDDRLRRAGQHVDALERVGLRVLDAGSRRASARPAAPASASSMSPRSAAPCRRRSGPAPSRGWRCRGRPVRRSRRCSPGPRRGRGCAAS